MSPPSSAASSWCSLNNAYVVPVQTSYCLGHGNAQWQMIRKSTRTGRDVMVLLWCSLLPPGRSGILTFRNNTFVLCSVITLCPQQHPESYAINGEPYYLHVVLNLPLAVCSGVPSCCTGKRKEQLLLLPAFCHSCLSRPLCSLSLSLSLFQWKSLHPSLLTVKPWHTLDIPVAFPLSLF